ncbi:uncharacterized protein LOC110859728 [Folsomia candida]|uniref:Uncharacterized protein n=1 Tax=Folsomia candida TaxID=158441 RepID=A0A226D9A9_FOLCA|nr:uncharacterized protein LOC110859728 [Folsomia candida]OXA41733.1 hypothetical protein Fcan01_23520 [Folsomia candida]
MGIFNHLKEKYPLIEFILETVESTAEYKDLMELWNKHFKKFEKSDPWKAASPPGVTFLHDNQPVGVKYVGGKLFYKVKKEGEKFGWKTSVRTKCRVENCPEMSYMDGYCYSHSTVKREILMIRDVANLDKVNINIVHPDLRKERFTDLGINLFLRGVHYEHKAIGQYLAKFPNAWFVIEKRWEHLSEESTRKFQSLGIQMSLMVSFHNSVATKPAEQIKLINCDIYTKSANLDDVNKTLALNNMGFEIMDANNSLNFANSHHLPRNFNRKLPYVYVGDNKEGGYRYGQNHSEKRQYVIKGSDSHQRAKSITMAGIDPENRHHVFQADPTTFTAEESLKKSLEVETLGHMGVLVANMLGMKTVGGHDVYNLAEKFTHFDHGWDEDIFKHFIVMMTGKEIVVKKDTLKTVPKEVDFMVPIFKTVGAGEKKRQVLDTNKMKKEGVQKKVYEKLVTNWI